MQAIMLNGEEKEKYKEAFYRMLSESDGDFLPPLSERGSTTDMELSGRAKNPSGISDYLNAVMAQNILLAVEDGTPLGFISFKDNYTDGYVNGEGERIYVSTVIISKAQRGRGICPRMYSALFEFNRGKDVYTRTWSTNHAHTAILIKLGFAEIGRIKDHRGVGVDTVYYRRPGESDRK
jgi:RimJ/RimL family protein N-acetyltransferase